MGGAGGRPEDDQVPRVVRLDDPLAEHPPKVVFGRHLVGWELGQRVRGLASGESHLHRTQFLEVT